MCQEGWLSYLWGLLWLFYKPARFRWTLVSMYLHQQLSLVWRCQTSLFSFPRFSLLAPATQGDLITKVHFRHSLGRTQKCGSILSRILSVQCRLAVLWVFIFNSRFPRIINTCLLCRDLRKDMFRDFSTFQTRKVLHVRLLLHTQVLNENEVKCPRFLSADRQTVLHNGTGGTPLHFGDHTSHLYQKQSRAATPMPMTVVPCRPRKLTLITERNYPKGMLKITWKPRATTAAREKKKKEIFSQWGNL